MINEDLKRSYPAEPIVPFRGKIEVSHIRMNVSVSNTSKEKQEKDALI